MLFEKITIAFSVDIASSVLMTSSFDGPADNNLTLPDSSAGIRSETKKTEGK
jgi:hypothetical protein